MKALLVPATKQNTQLQLLFYPNKNSQYCNVCISRFTWRQCQYTKLDPNTLESDMGKKPHTKRHKVWKSSPNIWMGQNRWGYTYEGYPESKFQWAIKKKQEYIINHVYCHLIYILYTTFQHSFHHCWGICHSIAPVFLSLHRRMMPPAMQSMW